MHLPRRVVSQMAIFTVGTLVAVSVMAFHYMQLPNYLFGVGHYRVTLELPTAAGLYASGNVTYRGTEVGRVEEHEQRRHDEGSHHQGLRARGRGGREGRNEGRDEVPRVSRTRGVEGEVPQRSAVQETHHAYLFRRTSMKIDN